MITLPRNDTPDWVPGSWKPDGARVIVACPYCVNEFLLPEGHAADEAGHVTPAITCPHGCGFSEDVTLAGWRGIELSN